MLERDAAFTLARDALARDYGVDLARETLVSDSSAQHQNRRDHTFVFERTDWQSGEARLRTSISVQGDEAVDFSRWIKVPEAWGRSRAKSGWRKFVVDELNTWLGVAQAIFVGVLFVLLLRKHLLPWRLSFGLALVPLALTLVAKLNAAPWFFSGYGTTTPLTNFLIRQAGGGAMGLVGSYLGDVLVISVTLGFLRWAFGWTPAALVVWPPERDARAEFWRDTGALLLASVAVVWCKNSALTFAAAAWIPERVASFSYPNVNALVPWLDTLARSLHSAWDQTFRLVMLASVVVLAWRRFPRLTIAVLLLQPIVNAARAADWPTFLYNAAAGELSLVITGFLLLVLWRFNFALIFLFYFTLALLWPLEQFLLKGGPNYRWDALPLALVPLIVVAFGWWQHRRVRTL